MYVKFTSEMMERQDSLFVYTVTVPYYTFKNEDVNKQASVAGPIKQTVFAWVGSMYPRHRSRDAGFSYQIKDLKKIRICSR